MNRESTRLCRRALLKKGAALTACLAGIPMSAPAVANKANKAVLNYQDQPRDGKICADCWAYVPGAGAAQGTCKAVEGPISPVGWCMAYSPKQQRARQGTITAQKRTSTAQLAASGKTSE